ncbi:MAG TPA: lanthionine synthetase LanC family protein [Solirubrobacteraceae bacterium]
MSEHLRQVQQVVGAVEITSPTSFTWFGAPSGQLPARVRREIDAAVARSHLLFTLRNHLYKDFYCVGFASRMAPEVGEASVSCQETQLTRELARANRGCGYWQPGWVVTGRHDEMVVVRRDGLELWIATEDCRPCAGGSIAPASDVALRLPNGSCELSPGYYSAMSDEALDPEGRGGTLVRLYWNVAPASAACLMIAITSHLNAARLPFRLKILSDALSYGRCDTAVLYMLKDDLKAGARELARAYAEALDGLRPGTPAFTKEIAHGVSLAEDAGDGESFGQHRCELLAEGLIRASEHGHRKLEQRMASVEGTFAQAGVDFELPYLRHGSADDYDLVLAPQPAVRRARGATDRSPDAAAFLAIATQIGERLVAEAVWDEDRCNWLALLPHAITTRQIGLSYGALNHELYDGTSGIALYLAQLHCLTGDEALRRTALGAARQALRVAAQDRLTIGLYTGTLGIAFASACVGMLLSEDSLAPLAARLVRRISDGEGEIAGFDFLSGRAGAISGLLILHEALGDRLFLALARQLGDDLVASAERTPRGWSWVSDMEGGNHPNLTGLSHGAAGAGHALLELFDATGDTLYRAGAEGAYRYERSWFYDDERNWPDLREQPRRSTQPRPGTCRVQWCHGAPGIALARIHAYEVLGDPVYRDEALTALATTESQTEMALRRSTLSYCLCHGLGGNADVLLEGRRLRSPNAANRANGANVGGSLPVRIGAAGIGAHAESGMPWPCGIPVPGRETPGLMLGLAGIGHFYMRLAFPEAIPSMLLPRRADVARFAALAGPRDRIAVADHDPRLEERSPS